MLRQREAHFHAQLLRNQAQQKALNASEAVMKDARWKALRVILERMRDAEVHDATHMEGVDPFQIGLTQGRIRLIEELLSIEESVPRTLKNLAEEEQRLQAELDRIRNFQLRPQEAFDL